MAFHPDGGADHIHVHTTMHRPTHVRLSSKWRERLSRPSHKPLMILSCLSSIEILNFSTANNHHFYGVVGLPFISIQRSWPDDQWMPSMLRIPGTNWSSYDYTCIVHDPAAGVKNHVLSWRCHPSYYVRFGLDSSRWRHAHSVPPTICYWVIPTVKPVFWSTESREACAIIATAKNW
jgi:hypothetical protein